MINNLRRVPRRGFGNAGRRKTEDVIKSAKRLAMVVFVLLDLAVPLAFIGPVLFGGKWIMVLSGSMVPALEVGGIVMVIPVNPADLQVGDIIVHRPPGYPNVIVAHRAVEKVSGDSLGFRTKGDANEEADSYIVTAKDVVGKVFWHIPRLGYMIDAFRQFSRTPLGLVLLTGVPGMIIVASELMNIRSLRDPRKMREKMLKDRVRRRKALFKNRMA